MFSPSPSRRARPSRKSVVWSAFLGSVAVVLALLIFLYDVYAPIAAMAVVAAIVSLYRMRGLKRGMPEPYGRGKVSIMDEKAMARGGILLVVGGFLSVVGLLGSIFIIGPFAFFVVLFGLAGGLPVSEVAFFLMVFSIERANSSRIFFVAEETARNGKSVMVRSVEMRPEASR